MTGGPSREGEGLRLLLLAVLLFGSVWPLSMHALNDATPVWFATARAGLAALALVLLLLPLDRLRLPGRGDLGAVVMVGTFQLAGFFLLAHLALPLVGAARTAILSNVTLIWLVPLSMLVLGEKVSPRRWAAAGVALAGVLIMTGPWAFDWAAPGVLVGHALLLGSALSWSIAIIALRRFPPRAPMVELLPWSFLLAALLLALAAIWREPAGGIGAGSWLHAAFIGLVAAPIGTWAVVESGRRLPAVTASVGFLLVPVLGLALAHLWLQEPLGWDLVAGGLLIVASVVMAARA
ncbi:MAG: DMT family transporter [Rhodovarius sp.]|nr:DMT family transporter [Rhodovarius sp.]